MTHKTDILCLRRRELLQMVDNCGFGPVLTIQQLRYYCDNNDVRGTDGRGVSLLRYAATLTEEYFRPAVKPKDYIEQKRLQAERNAEAVRAAQDIGEIPEVARPQRKMAALESFKTFCETYFSEIFYLPWSPDHLHVISKIERAVRNGGLFALAMPRGSRRQLHRPLT